jgi:predicted O-linked N-acetylglucosamine transferase (SPINDLY family)
VGILSWLRSKDADVEKPAAHEKDAARLITQGNAHLASQRYEDAARAYARSVELAPQRADAEIGLACALESLGRQPDAEVHYRRALSLEPRHVMLNTKVGDMLRSLGRFEEAAACYRQAVDVDPDFALAYSGLAESLASLGRRGDALTAYRSLIARKPDVFEAYNNAGNLLLDLGRRDEAIAMYRQTLELRPDSAGALNNLGRALTEAGSAAEAVDFLERAIELAPRSPVVRHNLGKALQALGRADDAVVQYRAALEIDPVMVAAHVDLGTALHAMNRLHDARASFEEALRLDPRHVAALNNAGVVQKDLGFLREAMQSFESALGLDPDYFLARSNLLFVHNFLFDEPEDTLVAEARSYGEIVKQRARPFTDWLASPEASRPLRVGFVSGDLGDHPVAFFTESVFAEMAKQRDAVELIAYVTTTRADATTARIRRPFSAWHPVVGVSDEQVAQRIRNDGIDILIDLSGHTAYNRLPVFAWKPAPVQATWLGYFATTGVEAIDYIVADPWTLPPSLEASFTEKAWRLPNTRLCFTAPADPVAVSPPPSRANGFVTLGCFNNLAKIGEPVIELWADILRRLPMAMLFLKTAQLAHEAVQDDVRDRFARHHIDPDRLIMEGQSARPEYLAAYGRVDFALDPFPYTGGATTAEALWMGVPVLTLEGERFVSRQGVGLLVNAGLPDWIAKDRDDYVRRAVDFAADAERLAVTRSGLREQFRSSPAMDATRFAADFIAMLQQMRRTGA